MTKKEKVLEEALRLAVINQNCDRCVFYRKCIYKYGLCEELLISHFKTLAQRKVG